MSEVSYTDIVAWINKQDEEADRERALMALRRFKQDEEFVVCLKHVAKNWKNLSTKERLLVSGIYKHHTGKRCFTSNQRSAVIAMYLKHKAV